MRKTSDLASTIKIEISDAQKLEALNLASSGKPLKLIQAALGVSARDFWAIKHLFPDLYQELSSARHDGLENLADDLMTIADDEPDVQRARLKSDNTKWLLSKRKPEVYGDRIDLNVNNTVDLQGAIAAAKARVLLPQSDQDKINASQAIDVTSTNIDATTGNKSVGDTNDDIFE